MKKKLIVSIMTACLMLSVVGCGAKEETVTTEAVTEAEQGEKNTKEENATEVATEETTVVSDTPVFGGENVEGYEGFKYLYEEILMTETEENKETGKKERTQLTVYIPDDEYASSNGNYAYSTLMGVSFRVEMDPSMLRYDAEYYCPAENLDYYVDSKYDPFVNAAYKYRDVVVTEAEEVGENAVRTTVEYCKYNEWEDTYSAVFCTYYLKELENGEMVMVSVEIDSRTVTGKSTLLIEELEQFYQFDIDWDAERAEQKVSNFAENGSENVYAVGNLLFELPEGWDEEDDLSSYEVKVFAPGGDFMFSSSMISISEQYMGYNEKFDLQIIVDENAKDIIKGYLGVEVDEYTAELCKTNIGNAAKVKCSTTMNGVVVDIVIYFVISDHNIYTMMAVQSDQAIEDAVAVLEGIVTTGQIRSY